MDVDPVSANDPDRDAIFAGMGMSAVGGTTACYRERLLARAVDADDRLPVRRDLERAELRAIARSDADNPAARVTHRVQPLAVGRESQESNSVAVSETMREERSAAPSTEMPL